MAVDIVCFMGVGVVWYLLVCICVFSKWVEAGFIANKQAATVAKWFHLNVTCRFGMPAYVRADRGGEFRGVFARYLD